MTSKKQFVFFLLFGFFLTNALLAELIGVKIFSLEKLLGIAPLEIVFWNDIVLSLNLTAGVILWPIVFIISDIINDYFGKKGVMQISYATAFFVSFAFLAVYTATKLPPADFWMNVNAKDKLGNSFDVNYAYSLLFGQGLGIIIGSLTAFLIGQIIDAAVFQHIKTLTKEKHIWIRATFSTIISQLIDSFVVLGIAFYIFGNWSLDLVIAVGIVNFCYKVAVAIIMIPLLYIIHWGIDGYLGGKIQVID